MRKVVSFALICFMIITVFSGCAILQKLGLQESENDELHPVSSIVMNEDEAKKLNDKVQIRLYFANEDNTKLKMEIRYIPMTEAKKSVNNLANVIVEELIKGPSKDSGLKRTIPEGVKLASRVKIDTETATATVDLTKDWITKHSGQKDAERLTIYSVVNSLTELKEVEKVRFTVNGKKQSEFKGNFKFDVPFPRTESLISREAPASSTIGTGDAKDKKKGDTDKNDKKKDEKKNDEKKDESKTGSSEESGDANETFGETDGIEVIDGEVLE